MSSVFIQGQTRRWGLAWSFHEVEDSDTKKLENFDATLPNLRDEAAEGTPSRSGLEFVFGL